MSRVGKSPIELPSGVTVLTTKSGVEVKGPKGTLSQRIDPDISVKVEDGTLTVERPTDQKRHKALHGLYRALINNMVHGVSVGYSKTLELVGVGFRVSNTGQQLELIIGYSHPIIFEIPKEIQLETVTEKGSNPKIILKSIDKELLGQVAAKIKAFRKPEPYKGKGIMYSGEYIRRKQGKTAGK